jgi:hypothetical protein
MSRKKENKFKSFLSSKGYYFVFTIICALCLFSYFLANDAFEKKQHKEVLGASAVRGVWVQGKQFNDCPESESLSVSGCIKSSFFDDYKELPMQRVFSDNQDRILFSNDVLFLSGIFTPQDFIDNEVWDNMYVGELNLRINNKQWVFEDVVWSREENTALVSLVEVDDGYLIVLHPSVTLSQRTKRFWVFKYSSNSDTVSQLYFTQSQSRKVFIESSDVSVLEKDSILYLVFERFDPSLFGSSEVIFYEFNSDLEYWRSFVLQRE